MKKLIVMALAAIMLTGCAASLKFVDQQSGHAYFGKTGSTSGHHGSVTATIAGESYNGSYNYSPSGGGYTIGTVGGVMASGVALSTSGNGLITMRGDQGHYVRCVFNFNTGDGSGLGTCRRNDGHMYDLVIDR